MLSAPDAALLVVAGVVAGIVGTAGGITSLVSYPALIAVGLAPLPANVANIVALVTCWPGAAAASRPELAGRGAWLLRWSVVAALGGAGGALLLLSTPPGAFARIVPFLITAASATLLVQPKLRLLHERGSGRAALAVLAVGLGFTTLYNGYFGAGAGVMTLTLLLVSTHEHLPTANALKNMVIGAATAASALVLVVDTRVAWPDVGVISAGLFVGSLIGPRVARLLHPDLLRWLVALAGFGLAGWLWANGGAGA